MPPADLTAGLDYVRLHLALERLFGVVRRDSQPSGLSLTAASTLRRLERNGAHRLCELHAPEGVSQPAMTQLVTRLEKEGLARRGSDPADRRVVIVSITDAGREAVERRRTGNAEALSERLRALSAADRAAILAALPAMERLSDLITDSPG